MLPCDGAARKLPPVFTHSLHSSVSTFCCCWFTWFTLVSGLEVGLFVVESEFGIAFHRGLTLCEGRTPPRFWRAHRELWDLTALFVGQASNLALPETSWITVKELQLMQTGISELGFRVGDVWNLSCEERGNRTTKICHRS